MISVVDARLDVGENLFYYVHILNMKIHKLIKWKIIYSNGFCMLFLFRLHEHKSFPGAFWGDGDDLAII